MLRKEAASAWLLYVLDQLKYSEPSPSATLARKRFSASRPVYVSRKKNATVPRIQKQSNSQKSNKIIGNAGAQMEAETRVIQRQVHGCAQNRRNRRLVAVEVAVDKHLVASADEHGLVDGKRYGIQPTIEQSRCDSRRSMIPERHELSAKLGSSGDRADGCAVRSSLRSR